MYKYIALYALVMKEKDCLANDQYIAQDKIN